MACCCSPGGLFKKVVIADRLGLFVDAVYDNVHGFTGLPLLVATYAYSFQIYMDFSGYTDMALGSAWLFNINLTQNFNSPYLAASVADFWRRWHISFSRWLFDYLFKPLQMHWRDWKTLGTAAALFVTFLISGLWHGASWGFVAWGLLHGAYLACSVFYRPYQKKLHATLGLAKTRLLARWQIFATFNLVSFAWIFFRANSGRQALYIISHIFSDWHWARFRFDIPFEHENLVLTGLSLLGYFLITHHLTGGKSILDLSRTNGFYGYLMCSTLLLMIFLLGNYYQTKSFIYFQF